MTSDPPHGARTVDLQVVIVTGTGSGIGATTALALATAGHHVYAGLRDTNDRNADRALQWRDLAQRAQLDVVPIELDVTSEASCYSAVELVLRARGRLDVIVNNAGTLMTGIAESFTPSSSSTSSTPTPCPGCGSTGPRCP